MNHAILLIALSFGLSVFGLLFSWTARQNFKRAIDLHKQYIEQLETVLAERDATIARLRGEA